MRGKRKKGFTLEEHEAMGRRLKRAIDELNGIKGDIDRAYVKKLSRPMTAAIGRVTMLKCALDSALFEEWPKVARPSIYYGSEMSIG